MKAERKKLSNYRCSFIQLSVLDLVRGVANSQSLLLLLLLSLFHYLIEKCLSCANTSLSIQRTHTHKRLSRNTSSEERKRDGTGRDETRRRNLNRRRDEEERERWRKKPNGKKSRNIFGMIRDAKGRKENLIRNIHH